MFQLDATDKQLLNALQANGKLSIKELAQHINLSTTPTYERLKKLEKSGAIEKYVAIINPKIFGRKLAVFCEITLNNHNDKNFEEFERFIDKMDEIVEVNYIAGNHDLLLKMYLNSMDDYEDIVMKKLSKLSIIGNIQSSFVIKQVKNEIRVKL
jgi:Lrp/AsnC family leucine-responsive transcriptional regulator